MNAELSNEAQCPICDRQVRAKAMRKLYEVPVCKKCRNAFANRRQGAYLLDVLLLYVLSMLFGAALGLMFPEVFDQGLETAGSAVFYLAYMWLFLPILFALKDGFRGYSPGKWLLGVRVVDRETLEPIGFGRALKRNLCFIVPFAPLVILVRMIKGRRWGDGWANTLVVWTKHAHRVPFDKRGILCLGCGYDLTGNVSGRCPECGLPLPERVDRLETTIAHSSTSWSAFPTMTQAAVLTVVFVATQLVLGFVAGITMRGAVGGPLTVSVINTLSCIATLLLAGKWGGLKLRRALSFRPIPPVLLLPALLSAGALAFVLNDVERGVWWLLPPPDAFNEFFDNLMGVEVSLFQSLLLMALVAPLTEEVLFRGLLLGGLLKTRPPWLSIAFTAGLFALMHLNIWKFPAAIATGILFGWWYSRTMSVWPCVFGHAMYNGIATMMAWGGLQETLPVQRVSEPLPTQPWWLSFGALACLVAGCWWCHRWFGPRPRSEGPVAAVPLARTMM